MVYIICYLLLLLLFDIIITEKQLIIKCFQKKIKGCDKMKHSKIRNALKDANIKQWELAEMLGIAETTLCVKLRRELPDREQEQIMKLIYEKGGAKNDENN